ncbi:MAG: ADP-ribosylation factor-directed GTPase activating protein isoform b [Pirellulales bacterium]
MGPCPVHALRRLTSVIGSVRLSAALLLAAAVGLVLGCRQELAPLQTVVKPTSSTAAGSATTPSTATSSSGTSSSGTSSSGTTPAAQDRAAGSSKLPPELEARIERILRSGIEDRRLTVADNGAWQILHGVLAYGRNLPLTLDSTGKKAPAIEYLLGGGPANGWVLVPGDINPETKRRGLRATVDAGSKTGQGHQDQWIGYMADCQFPLETEVRAQGQSYQLGDMIWQAQYDVARNPLREYSWTLMGLTQYLPTNSEWTAADGNRWSIERLLQEELDQEVKGAACGGTHRLGGLAIALRNHRRQGRPASGVWDDVRARLDEYVVLARSLQNPDGTFSTHFFIRPSSSPDVTGNLAATGHILEFLTLVLSPEELQEPWITAAATQLCDMLESTSNLNLECGALYHALHGLYLLDQTLGSSPQPNPTTTTLHVPGT